jgi:hypothetical protein
VSAALDQLDAQQALLTDSLRKMLEGQWTGFPSLQADLEALSPGIQLAPRPPVLESEGGPPTPSGWWAQYDPNTYMPGQVNSWSCSACALAWVLRATQLDPGASEQSMIDAIGYPANINATYGLMDGSGSQLRRVLSEYGVATQQAWLDYDTCYATYGDTTGLMSGGAWYHWVGVRGRDGPNLAIANSAPGYKGVYSTLSREDFNRLGPFSCVWLLH